MKQRPAELYPVTGRWSGIGRRASHYVLDRYPDYKPGYMN